jgi:preprotein translocase subunit SecA
MSLLNSVLKVFVGDKSKQDVKSIMPIVKEIKNFEPEVATLNHDELRAKTEEFKSKIQSACEHHNIKIEQLRETIKTTSDIDEK